MSAPVLEARSLSKDFVQAGARIEVLRGLDLSVAAGETVAILGKSGSGKSTLLSLLAGLDHPTSGSVLLSGRDLSAMDEESLALFRARQLSIVFQQFHLMSNLTALENVSLPLEISRDVSLREARTRALSALERVGLSARRGHFPSQLSGGEKQRVAIARAFIARPQVLLADEPSGSLDSESGESVMSLLFGMAEHDGMTLVLVTHNEELASRCRRRFVLDSGRLRDARG